MAFADGYIYGKDSAASIIFDIALILNYICSVMLFFIAVFIIKQFTLPQSPIRSGYYAFILISCVTHVIVFSIYRICELIEKHSPSSIIESIEGFCLWYHSFNMGFATTVLACNRFTALIFPTKYERIWSRQVIPCFWMFPSVSQANLSNRQKKGRQFNF